ncbi:MAG: hypothetical protein AMJ43_02600 [Coxiella sp. DG_40]|nr:MAG: hypothetical protein AMJ43_02600 [Coxiella sp. DG_40]
MNKLSLLLLVYLLAGCATNNIANHLQSSVIQNNLAYIDKNDTRYLTVQKKQKELARNYLQHWFSPWTGKNQVLNYGEIKNYKEDIIQKYTLHPGWNQNMQRHSPLWIAKLASNMNLQSFPNLIKKAIVIRDTYVREFPTLTPSFSNLNAKAGGWYPFDNMQDSLIVINTPVIALQVSRDGAWYLIMAPSYIGWVPSSDIAFVDHKFIKKWRTGHYIVVNKDNVAVFDDKFNFQLQTRIGTLYPLYSTTRHYYKILIATSNISHNAVIRIANLPKRYSKKFPIKIIPKNIANVANSMLGNPYGWGNLYRYRDCSSTLMDLFAGFGIWLPRNSFDQAMKSDFPFISFAGMSDREKVKIILSKAIPFLTLIYKPGHILLYIGQRHGQIYIFHTPWGLHTRNILLKESRAVIGQTIITPLRLGQGYLNVIYSLLNKVDGMVVLAHGKQNLTNNLCCKCCT